MGFKSVSDTCLRTCWAAFIAPPGCGMLAADIVPLFGEEVPR